MTPWTLASHSAVKHCCDQLPVWRLGLNSWLFLGGWKASGAVYAGRARYGGGINSSSPEKLLHTSPATGGLDILTGFFPTGIFLSKHQVKLKEMLKLNCIRQLWLFTEKWLWLIFTHSQKPGPVKWHHLVITANIALNSHIVVPEFYRLWVGLQGHCLTPWPNYFMLYQWNTNAVNYFCCSYIAESHTLLCLDTQDTWLSFRLQLFQCVCLRDRRMLLGK